MSEQAGQHDVRYDYAGHGGHPRLTCCSPGCNGATLSIYPSMRSVANEKAREFLAAHPPKDGLITDADRRGAPIPAEGDLFA